MLLCLPLFTYIGVFNFILLMFTPLCSFVYLCCLFCYHLHVFFFTFTFMFAYLFKKFPLCSHLHSCLSSVFLFFYFVIHVLTSMYMLYMHLNSTAWRAAIKELSQSLITHWDMEMSCCLSARLWFECFTCNTERLSRKTSIRNAKITELNG